MTIPIIPGPFSFLAGAGEAVGEYGKAREEHRRYAQQQAQKAIEHLDNLVQLGIVPASTMTQPVAQHLSTLAGYAPTTETLPQPKEQRQQIESTELTRIASPQGTEDERRRVANVPTTGDVNIDRVMSSLTPDQIMQMKQIPSSDAATILQDSQKDQAQFHADVIEGTAALFKGDKRFRWLAEQAEAGTLSYWQSVLASQRAMRTEEWRIRAENSRELMGMYNQIHEDYRSQVTNWVRQQHDKQFAVRQPTMSGEQLTPEQQAAEMDKWRKANPPPDWSKFFESELAAHKMTTDQFNNELKAGLEPDEITGSGSSTTRTGDTSKGGAGGPTDGGDAGTVSDGGEGANLDPDRLREGAIIGRLMTSDPAAGGRSLAKYVQGKQLASMTARKIMTQLRLHMSPDKYRKFLEAYQGDTK